MAADCWACKTNINITSSNQGIKGNPLGACYNCGVLACGHHGYRNRKVPEFLCAECLGYKVAATIAAEELDRFANSTNASNDLLIHALNLIRALYRRAPTTDTWRISLEELTTFSIALKDLFINLEHLSIDYTQSIDVSLEDFREAFIEAENQTLIVALAKLVRYLYSGKYPADYPEYLIYLANNLSGDDNDNISNKRIPVSDFH
ncbi:MAG TPA: hypothetical protein VD816_10565 [Ohtaekwangia sp.]|nr:hypothetical protein [Ohtaekwangia sp.]